MGADPSVGDSGRFQRDSASPAGDATSSGEDGGDEVPAIACPPMSTASYEPPAYVPAMAHQGACAPQAIAEFVAACANASDGGRSCVDWQNVNVAADGGAGTACGNCIFAPANNGAVWVDPGGRINPNYSGCIQITDPVNGTACATAQENLNSCIGVACDYCPPSIAPPDSVDNFTGCVSAAASADCNRFDLALDACASDYQLDGGANFTCSPSSGGTEDWTYIATLICGAD